MTDYFGSFVCISGVFQGCFHNVCDCGPFVRFLPATIIVAALIIATIWFASNRKQLGLWNTIWVANTSNATFLVMSLIPVISHDKHKDAVKVCSMLLMAIVGFGFAIFREYDTAIGIGFSVFYLFIDGAIEQFVCTDEHRNDIKKRWSEMGLSRLFTRCCWSQSLIYPTESENQDQSLVFVSAVEEDERNLEVVPLISLHQAHV